MLAVVMILSSILHFTVFVKASMIANCQSDIKFINFLQNELELSSGDIDVALRKRELENGPLPMLLWQYGLVDIEQLERIFDWLEEQA